jgi:hypothetical protein
MARPHTGLRLTTPPGADHLRASRRWSSSKTSNTPTPANPCQARPHIPGPVRVGRDRGVPGTGSGLSSMTAWTYRRHGFRRSDPPTHHRLRHDPSYQRYCGRMAGHRHDRRYGGGLDRDQDRGRHLTTTATSPGEFAVSKPPSRVTGQDGRDGNRVHFADGAVFKAASLAGPVVRTGPQLGPGRSIRPQPGPGRR